MGAKRAVEGRSAPYDTLLFEWQKATNPSFVAKLEEKEKAIAAAKAAAAAAPPKEKKKKSSSSAKKSAAGAGVGGAGGNAGGGAGGAVFIEDDDMDMYDAGAGEDAMDQELVEVLRCVAEAGARDRTTPLPMAVRGWAGCYTSRAKRMRNLRELLREGLAPNGGAYGINGYATWSGHRGAGGFTAAGGGKKGVSTGA